MNETEKAEFDRRLSCLDAAQPPIEPAPLPYRIQALECKITDLESEVAVLKNEKKILFDEGIKYKGLYMDLVRRTHYGDPPPPPDPPPCRETAEGFGITKPRLAKSPHKHGLFSAKLDDEIDRVHRIGIETLRSFGSKTPPLTGDTVFEEPGLGTMLVESPPERGFLRRLWDWISTPASTSPPRP